MAVLAALLLGFVGLAWRCWLCVQAWAGPSLPQPKHRGVSSLSDHQNVYCYIEQKMLKISEQLD